MTTLLSTIACLTLGAFALWLLDKSLLRRLRVLLFKRFQRNAARKILARIYGYNSGPGLDLILSEMAVDTGLVWVGVSEYTITQLELCAEVMSDDDVRAYLRQMGSSASDSRLRRLASTGRLSCEQATVFAGCRYKANVIQEMMR